MKLFFRSLLERTPQERAACTSLGFNRSPSGITYVSEHYHDLIAAISQCTEIRTISMMSDDLNGLSPQQKEGLLAAIVALPNLELLRLELSPTLLETAQNRDAGLSESSNDVHLTDLRALCSAIKNLDDARRMQAERTYKPTYTQCSIEIEDLGILFSRSLNATARDVLLDIIYECAPLLSNFCVDFCTRSVPEYDEATFQKLMTVLARCKRVYNVKFCRMLNDVSESGLRALSTSLINCPIDELSVHIDTRPRQIYEVISSLRNLRILHLNFFALHEHTIDDLLAMFNMLSTLVLLEELRFSNVDLRTVQLEKLTVFHQQRHLLSKHTRLKTVFYGFSIEKVDSKCAAAFSVILGSAPCVEELEIALIDYLDTQLESIDPRTVGYATGFIASACKGVCKIEISLDTGDPSDFIKSVAVWFDLAMQRLQPDYKNYVELRINGGAELYSPNLFEHNPRLFKPMPRTGQPLSLVDQAALRNITKMRREYAICIGYLFHNQVPVALVKQKFLPLLFGHNINEGIAASLFGKKITDLEHMLESPTPSPGKTRFSVAGLSDQVAREQQEKYAAKIARPTMRR